MSANDVLSWLLAVLALGSGWRVFRTASMVRATFALLLSFVAVAGLMLQLSAPYLGAATLFMMTVEMLVMAVFMVMFMMNPAGLNPMKMVHQPRLAVVAGVGVFLALSAAIAFSPLPLRPVAATAPVLRDLGLELLGDSMLVFETAGVALLATMVGTVILSARSGRYGPSDAGSVPPPLEPGGQPAGAKPKKVQGGGHGGMHGMGHGGHGGQAGQSHQPGDVP